MLKRRHMTPQWGERSALSPEQQDDMVIKELPDIFITGHTHSHAYEWYKEFPVWYHQLCKDKLTL